MSSEFTSISTEGINYKPKKIKMKKKNLKIKIKEKLVSNIEIDYNSETYNLENSNDTKLVVKKIHTDYQTEPLSEKKPIINFTYNNISNQTIFITCM